MGRREPRRRASALPRRGPHLYFICPAELNSAGIKVLGPRPKTLGRRKAPPRRRRGPRRGRRKKAPRTEVRGACGFCLLVQLDEAGQVLVALLGGPTPPGRGPPGPPSLFYLSGGTEFRRHQGFVGPQPKTLGRRIAPPRRRRGPRRGRRIKRAPDVSSGALVRACLLVELHQSGEMLIALLGGSAPPGRGPPGTPSLFYLSGGTEFRRHQGFGPTAQNAWTAQNAAPPSAGPPKRPPYKTGPGRFRPGPLCELVYL